MMILFDHSRQMLYKYDHIREFSFFRLIITIQFLATSKYQAIFRIVANVSKMFIKIFHFIVYTKKNKYIYYHRYLRWTTDVRVVIFLFRNSILPNVVNELSLNHQSIQQNSIRLGIYESLLMMELCC
jgi:hypothetical protein